MRHFKRFLDVVSTRKFLVSNFHVSKRKYERVLIRHQNFYIKFREAVCSFVPNPVV